MFQKDINVPNKKHENFAGQVKRKEQKINWLTKKKKIIVTYFLEIPFQKKKNTSDLFSHYSK